MDITHLPPIDPKRIPLPEMVGPAPGTPEEVALASAIKNTRAKLAAGIANPISGHFDTWPAHISNRPHPLHAGVSLDGHYKLADDQNSGKPQIVPKPKFLERLEAYLRRELKAIGAATSTRMAFEEEEEVAAGAESGSGSGTGRHATSVSGRSGGGSGSDLTVTLTARRPSALRAEAADERRLQAHREAFDYLIAEFRTYRPMLLAIKTEYELALQRLRTRISELEPLKQKLVAVAEQADRKVMEMKDQEKEEVKELKRKLDGLHREIGEFRNKQGDFRAQIEKLQEELADEHKRYRDEADMRKLLISEKNEQGGRIEELETRLRAAQGEQKEDVELLKIALSRAREAETNATKKLNQMVADYCDVVPKRDFDQLTVAFKTLQERSDILQREFELLRKEHGILVETHTQVVRQRNEAQSERDNLKRSATPRPDWSRCADVIYGGQTRWAEMATGRRSQEMLALLIDELDGANLGLASDIGEYLEPRGTGIDVPGFLRFDGTNALFQIRNKRYSRRDCAMFVRDVWRDKIALENDQAAISEQKGTVFKRASLADHLDLYLKRAFGIERLRIEAAYNLVDSGGRFAYRDNRISLFFGILFGEVDEELYYDQLRELARLQLQMENAEKTTQGSTDSSGVLTVVAFERSLRSCYPKKEETFISKLLELAARELQLTSVSALTTPPVSQGGPPPSQLSLTQPTISALGTAPPGAATGATSSVTSNAPGGPSTGANGTGEPPIPETLTPQMMVERLGSQTLVEYRALFTEDEEGRTGPFLDAVLEELKTQRLLQAQRFIDATKRIVSERVFVEGGGILPEGVSTAIAHSGSATSRSGSGVGAPTPELPAIPEAPPETLVPVAELRKGLLNALSAQAGTIVRSGTQGSPSRGGASGAGGSASQEEMEAVDRYLQWVYKCADRILLEGCQPVPLDKVTSRLFNMHIVLNMQ